MLAIVFQYGFEPILIQRILIGFEAKREKIIYYSSLLEEFYRFNPINLNPMKKIKQNKKC